MQKEMLTAAVAPFHRTEVRDFIENVRRNHEQIIDNVNLDTVLLAGFDTNCEETAERVIQRFHEFIEENRDEILTLRILYDQRYRDRPMVIAQLKGLYERLKTRLPYVKRLMKRSENIESKTTIQMLESQEYLMLTLPCEA